MTKNEEYVIALGLLRMLDAQGFLSKDDDQSVEDLAGIYAGLAIAPTSKDESLENTDIVRLDLDYPNPSEPEKEALRAVYGLRSEVRVPLRSMQPESKGPVINAYIQWSDQGIVIRFDGYGEKTAQDGEGWPILVEFAGGMPRVYVWNDINEEDPVTVDLDTAHESLREED